MSLAAWRMAGGEKTTDYTDKDRTISGQGVFWKWKQLPIRAISDIRGCFQTTSTDEKRYQRTMRFHWR